MPSKPIVRERKIVLHGEAFYALIVLKLPICAALKSLFPALMTDEGRGYVV